MTNPRLPRDPSAAARTDAVAVARKGRLRRVRKMLVLATCVRWRKAVLKGVAATVEHRAVPFGQRLATIIDVGAHHGQFALLARELYPDAEIVCLEPLPAAIEKLRAVHAEDDRVTILPFAAASVDGHRRMHVSRKTDSSSLLPILRSYVEAFPGTQEARTLEVEVRTLDALVADRIQPPALLKIDVQGGELEVLAGATTVLQQVDVVFVECSFIEFYEGQPLADEIICEFKRHGLRLDGVYSVVHDGDGRCFQADLLFRRGSR